MRQSNKLTVLLIILPLFLINSSLSCLYADISHNRPYGLMIEFIRNPAGTVISDSLPEFSWVIPAKAVSQKAYQVLLSTSAELINNNKADVWNSGEVRSSNSINISLAGQGLKEKTVYYWKVRIRDDKNKLSEYSEVQKFKTGSFGKSVSSGNVFQVERILPVSETLTSDGNTLFDFGKDAFGTVELNYNTNITETLIVYLGEKLLNGKIDLNPGGAIRFAEVKLPVNPAQSKYTLRLLPDKRNTTGAAILIPDTLGVVFPFRYTELKTSNNIIGKNDISQLALFNYFDEDESIFTSSDTILNQIWNICKYSMKATSFTGIYIDGDRERIAYEADAYINQLGHYAVDREYAMARRTVEHFMDHPTWPTEWLLHTAMMAYQDFYYTGDTELLKKYYNQLKSKTLIDLARNDGLISSQSQLVNGSFMQRLGFRDTADRIRDIVDWPPAQKDTGWKLATSEGERDGYEMLPVNTVVNCFFYNNMKIMSEIAGIVGNQADRIYFEQMSLKVKSSINKILFDQKKGIYIDGEGSLHSSLHSNMMALAFGIVPENNIDSVVDFIKSRGMACSVYGAQYLLEGLYLAGEQQYALDLMRATNDRSWWNMIRSGSTITLEAWDMKYKPNLDWNHAWGAVPANIIPRYLWGIQPKSAGFGTVAISPQMGDLTFSTIRIPVISGHITGEFNIESKKLKTYSIELPANTKGEFTIKLSPGENLFLNGKKIKSSADTIRLNPGTNRIEIRSQDSSGN
jgi:alpha-L-rhamnosidase